MNVKEGIGQLVGQKAKAPLATEMTTAIDQQLTKVPSPSMTMDSCNFSGAARKAAKKAESVQAGPTAMDIESDLLANNRMAIASELELFNNLRGSLDGVVEAIPAGPLGEYLVAQSEMIRAMGDGVVDKLKKPTGFEQALKGKIEQPVAVKGITFQGQPMSGLSDHFRTWLDAHGYSSQAFARDDLPGGSFGGRLGDQDTIAHEPVIFIHGNSDKAMGTGTAGQSGWNNSIQYFLDRGYQPSELYATTWGPADAHKAGDQYHSKENLSQVRSFIEAVLEYTGADHVNVVSHSMGVTLSRKAIKGGMGWDGLAGGYYDLGRPLTDKVDTFVGIAGANQGLASCFKAGPTNPTSGITNGFYPGIAPGGIGQSWFLQNLNTGDHFEGNHVFSIWSTVDEICGPGNLVFGAHTSEIPGQDGEKVFKRYPYGHFNLKDRTAAIQFDMITKHRAG